MYAIVEIQGQQFKAEPEKFLYVHYLGDAHKEGDTVEFDRVLLGPSPVLHQSVNQRSCSLTP